MSVSFYKQDDEEPNPEFRLVCPYCGDEILISEYGEKVICLKCEIEFSISEAVSKDSWIRLSSPKVKTE